jgi:hypothetical protein
MPAMNGSSFFSAAPPVSTSYVMRTRGGRTRKSDFEFDESSMVFT